MKRERGGGGGRESKRERGGKWVKWGGNTGTSHELNRTANSSTREGEEGGDGLRGRAGGAGGTDRFYITLRTHTHTQKKRDTSCISGQSCECRAMALSSFCLF